MPDSTDPAVPSTIRLMRVAMDDLMRVALVLLLCSASNAVGPLVRAALADSPSPVLANLFPAGGAVGSTVRVAIEGTSLDDWNAVYVSDPRVVGRRVDAKTAELTIPSDSPLGIYDVRIVGKFGISGPRAFQVSNRQECSEVEPNDGLASAAKVPLGLPTGGTWINARCDKPGDIDWFRLTLAAKQSVLIELWGERLDSPVHGVLEVFDGHGKRLAASRGGTQVDPRLEFEVPADGEYAVRVADQTFLGGADFVYRLRIDAGPRLEAAMPCVVRQGESMETTVWGRNLTGLSFAKDVMAPDERTSGTRKNLWQTGVLESPRGLPGPLLMPRTSRQAGRIGLTWQSADSAVPLLVDVTDLPVVVDGADNHSAPQAKQLAIPCEVCGRLGKSGERDWYLFSAKQGEVLWLEAFADRIGSPADLELVVLDSEERELARFTDCVQNLGNSHWLTTHVDPEGRFVAPADGTYWIVVSDIVGAGQENDPRRVYRLSVRREDPDFCVTMLPRRSDQPAGINVPRGGRELVEVIAQRRRGFAAPLRLSAENLPVGVECPDAWIAAGESRGILVLAAQREGADWGRDVRWTASATRNSAALVGERELRRPVEGGVTVRAGRPTPWTRMTQGTPVGISPEVNLRVTAVIEEEKLFQGGIGDVMVDVERLAGADGPIRLRAIGLPRSLPTAMSTIPAGSSRGWLSVAIPETLPEGPFTFAVEAELASTSTGNQRGVLAFSNPLTVQVAPGRIVIRVEPGTPRKISRGQVIHVKYRAERQLGFIGKIHTELAAPGGVQGIRGRGVTFTGQTETGDIQIIATENAPLGPLEFLRLEAVGTVEDQGIYRAACFLDLEIVE
ncbi:MAG: PPC domain-containing protein [Pirellulales bacterium]